MIPCPHWSRPPEAIDGGACARGLYGGKPSLGTCLIRCEHGPKMDPQEGAALAMQMIGLDDGPVAQPRREPTPADIRLAEHNAAICRQCEHVKKDEDGQPKVKLTVNGFPVYGVNCGLCNCGNLSLIRGDCKAGKWVAGERAEAAKLGMTMPEYRRMQRDAERARKAAAVAAKKAASPVRPAPLIDIPTFPGSPPPRVTDDERKAGGMIDIVYPFRHSNTRHSPLRDEELRYAIESVRSYLKAEARIWVVGDRPAWLDGSVIHLPDPKVPGDHFVNSTSKIVAAARDPRMGERFIVSHDDMYFLRPTSIDQLLRPKAHAVSDTTVEAWEKGNRGWEHMKARSMRALREAGHDGTLYEFSTHMPMVYERDRFIEIADRFGLGVKSLSPQIIYHNLMRDHDPEKVERIQLVVHGAMPPEKLAGKLCGVHVLNHTASEFPTCLPLLKKWFDCEPTTASPVAAAPRRRSFVHPGNIGDVIYSLATVKGAGGGDYYLKLDSPRYRSAFRNHPAGECRISEDFARRLLPLLRAQPYINKAEVYAGQPVDHDFGGFIGMMRTGTGLLVDRHAHLVPDSDSRPHEPYLFAEPDPAYAGAIVIGRSPRYRNPRVGWDAYAEAAKLGRRVLFVGLPDEYREAVAHVPGIEHVEVDDFLALARVIAGCHLYIGNQSFCFAIAEALKVPRLVELSLQMPNCIPQGDRGRACIDGGELRRWIRRWGGGGVLPLASTASEVEQ